MSLDCCCRRCRCCCCFFIVVVVVVGGVVDVVAGGQISETVFVAATAYVVWVALIATVCCGLACIKLVSMKVRPILMYPGTKLYRKGSVFRGA